MNRFIIKRLDRVSLKTGINIGDSFEEFAGQDYGIIKDDTKYWSSQCIALSHPQCGFFTVPREDVELVDDPVKVPTIPLNAHGKLDRVLDQIKEAVSSITVAQNTSADLPQLAAALVPAEEKLRQAVQTLEVFMKNLEADIYR